MSDTLVHWYTRYRIEKAKIKARQRVELEHELAPLAVELGRAITQAREKGLSIKEIGFLIGLRNRTFIYDMMSVFAKSNSPTLPEPEVEPEPEPEPEKPKEPEYTIWYNGDVVTVRLGFEEYVLLMHKGEVTVSPDEWLHDTKERRKLYSKIIKEIENGTGQAE